MMINYRRGGKSNVRLYLYLMTNNKGFYRIGVSCQGAGVCLYPTGRSGHGYLLMLVTSSTSSELITESNFRRVAERIDAERRCSGKRVVDVCLWTARDVIDDALVTSATSLSSTSLSCSRRLAR